MLIAVYVFYIMNSVPKFINTEQFGVAVTIHGFYELCEFHKLHRC